MFHAITLSKSDPTPLYIQLASELGKFIKDNTFESGTKLPTIRSLSNQLGINRDTVVSAYKLLESKGLVESHIGKGTYISVLSPASTQKFTPDDHKICCSQIGLPTSYFPPSLCLNLSSQIIKAENWDCFIDPFFRERQLLKESVSIFLNSLHIPHHYAQVRVIKTMDSFLLELFKDTTKTGVCVESIRDLSWSCYLRSIGAKIYEVPLNDEGMDIDTLRKHLNTGNISYIFLSSLLQNPTGICYSPNCRREIVKLAKEYNCTIIDDITHLSFLNKSTPLNFSSNDPVIYMHQFSKLYLPYMNYTFAILPPTFIKRLRDSIECSFNERFLRHYLGSSELSHIISSTTTSFSQKYNLLVNSLKDLPLKITDSNGCTFLWIRVTKSKYDSLCSHLLSYEIIISPGELFSTSSLKGYFRISITHLTDNEIDKLIFVLKDFFNSKARH